LEELKKNAKRSIREPKNGIFKRGLEEDAIVAQGVINAEPIPLTYSFQPEAKTGVEIFNEITEAVTNVFEAKGFKITGTRFKIHKPSEIKALGDKAKGLQAGMPYLMIDMETANGTPMFQYVKLAPRFINQEKDSAAIAPIMQFISDVETIEKLLGETDPTMKLGNTKFNNLIKKFAANYRINEAGDAIVKKSESEVTYPQAQAIMPKLTPKQFKALDEKLVEPVIMGWYGIGTQLVTMDETSFLEKFGDEAKYIVREDFGDGTVYYESKDTGILYSLSKSDKQRSGYVKLNLYTEKDGILKVVPYKTAAGYEQKHQVHRAM
jgi:nucleoside diphosphate kinase